MTQSTHPDTSPKKEDPPESTTFSSKTQGSPNHELVAGSTEAERPLPLAPPDPEVGSANKEGMGTDLPTGDRGEEDSEMGQRKNAVVNGYVEQQESLLAEAPSGYLPTGEPDVEEGATTTSGLGQGLPGEDDEKTEVTPEIAEKKKAALERFREEQQKLQFGT